MVEDKEAYDDVDYHIREDDERQKQRFCLHLRSYHC